MSNWWRGVPYEAGMAYSLLPDATVTIGGSSIAAGTVTVTTPDTSGYWYAPPGSGYAPGSAGDVTVYPGTITIGGTWPPEIIQQLQAEQAAQQTARPRVRRVRKPKPEPALPKRSIVLRRAEA